MPKRTSEDDKKHGDKLEDLIDRTGSSSSQGKRGEAPSDDDSAGLESDDDELEDDEDDDEGVEDDENDDR